ncbi:bifunctional hydroxymethylpyrimidine kinase/phosphomethylpyrimidine kinase [Acidisoma cellulosilytica]|uniref:Bifunctional hydroxymethylpyrimidine kinase/phosphomethylpyrimidine kinase n=1 Tax=Acidisoma cellulosilyticum TaxID=2802395 RepID=A0A963Z4U8_9PROT|nr:PfkB family carbohydrate kinase [Acidisoma cellulosilyticum]MCB8882035.1 bifunctional hydroxymethylpyrimidine kinase/phosphomethylpyrimidine kinase [Acidisoma cellulosilyticum]
MANGAPPRLFTVGSVLADIRLDVPHLPGRGGDVIGSGASISAGGGFNILAAAARQGMACIFAGRHGNGPYGAQIRADCAREGIATVHPPASDGDSGFCLVMVEPDGERTFVSSPGVEAALAGRRFADLPLRPGDIVFASGYDLSYPELGPAIAAWMASLPRSIGFVIDPGPLVADIPASVMAQVMPRATVWTMNRREAELLTGTADPAAAPRRMQLSPDALFVLRDGAAGAFVLTSADQAPVLVPSPAVTMVDSTGAGDTHAGVLIAALASGLDALTAVARANAAAALSVTRRGPATAPDARALDRFIGVAAKCPVRRAAEVD